MWPPRKCVPPSNPGNRNDNADTDRVLPAFRVNTQTIINEVRRYSGGSKHRNHNQKSYGKAHHVHAASAFLKGPRGPGFGNVASIISECLRIYSLYHVMTS